MPPGRQQALARTQGAESRNIGLTLPSEVNWRARAVTSCAGRSTLATLNTQCTIVFTYSCTNAA